MNIHLAPMSAVIVLLCLPAWPQAPDPATLGQRGPGVPQFAVRTGYRVTLAIPQLNNARFLQFDSHGTLYVSQPNVGTISAFRPNPDGTFQAPVVVIRGQSQVHGMDFRDGWLWFTTSGSVQKGKVRPDGSGLDDVTAVIPDNGALPKGGGHWWRSLLVDDTGFYTSVGDPGNSVAVDDERPMEGGRGRVFTNPLIQDRQKIWRFNLDGTGKELFSSGLRNTEKLRFRPGTTEVWGCDHGSDNFGGPLGETAGRNQPITNALPPEELNHYVKGGFYGHPFIVGNNIPRIEYQNRPDLLDLARRALPPAMIFGAHWANNGFTFLEKDTFPGHKGDMFIAFHGSWNSQTPVGYRIERVVWDALSGKPLGSHLVVSCIGPDGRQVLGRPVDCAEAPDGTILFSVDAPQGRVYRISPAVN